MLALFLGVRKARGDWAMSHGPCVDGCPPPSAPPPPLLSVLGSRCGPSCCALRGHGAAWKGLQLRWPWTWHLAWQTQDAHVGSLFEGRQGLESKIPHD